MLNLYVVSEKDERENLVGVVVLVAAPNSEYAVDTHPLSNKPEKLLVWCIGRAKAGTKRGVLLMRGG